MTAPDYFVEKMRLYRKQNPLSQKKFVYVVKVGDTDYAFLRKSDIVVERKDIESLKTNDNIIKMF